MTTQFEKLHQGHRINKAFNSRYNYTRNESMSLLYCVTCSSEFHGCYCENVEDCLFCEFIPDLEII